MKCDWIPKKMGPLEHPPTTPICDKDYFIILDNETVEAI